MRGWYLSATVPAPTDRPLLISDGSQWGRGTRAPTGRWQTDDGIEAKFWQDVKLPPRAAYLSADGATIIPLRGLCDDIHLTALPGDELWATDITELSRGEIPYLRFTDVLNEAACFALHSRKPVFIAEWEWMRGLLRQLGWDTCYLRRTYA